MPNTPDSDKTSQVDDARIVAVDVLPPPEQLIRFFPVSGGPVERFVGDCRERVRLLVALLIGGVIAAPAAAWAVKVIPANSLGVAVGLLLLLTNAGTVAEAVGVPAVMWGAYAIAGFSVGLAVCRMRRRSLDARAAAVDEVSVR